jgi:hypothetical protein
VPQLCPICNKRKAERYCPAKGEKICAVCCGTEREVSIDCPSDCSYLIVARRYERENRKSYAAGQLPYRSVDASRDYIEEHFEIFGAVMLDVKKFAEENRQFYDADAITTLQSLAETFRTLDSGIYYERPPDAPLAHRLYQQLTAKVGRLRSDLSGPEEFRKAKTSDWFRVMVFALRAALMETNGRPRSRAFLDFLRVLLSPEAGKKTEDPRIIIP